MMNPIFFDLSLGVSGDMVSAACYSIMDEMQRADFRKRIGEAGPANPILNIKEVEQGATRGFSIAWKGPDDRIHRPEDFLESIRALSDSIGLAKDSAAIAMGIASDIMRAEKDAHGIDDAPVHLHEVGRAAGRMNIVSAGLCAEILSLQRRGCRCSAIAIGEGEILTEHGALLIPTPASSVLLEGLRFSFGPYDGEMATPTGIAIIRNLVGGQGEIPKAIAAEAFGFGERSYQGRRGFIRVLEVSDGGRL